MDDGERGTEYDWLTLDAGEEVVWADTPHEMSLVPALIVGIPLSIVLVGVFIIGGAYLTYRNTNYVVTTSALYRKTGVLSRSVQRIEFDKVQDTSYRQSFFGAQFGYGTVDVSTAGSGGIELSFQSVAEPQRVQGLINERIRERGGPSGERGGDGTAVLDDILTELRAIRQAVEGMGLQPMDGTAPQPVEETGPQPNVERSGRTHHATREGDREDGR